MWPASASNATEWARTAATTSPAMKATISASAAASRRRSAARFDPCSCTAYSLDVWPVASRPRVCEREPLGRRRVREQEAVGEARWREVGEVPPRQRDVRAPERLEV